MGHTKASNVWLMIETETLLLYVYSRLFLVFHSHRFTELRLRHFDHSNIHFFWNKNIIYSQFLVFVFAKHGNPIDRTQTIKVEQV